MKEFAILEREDWDEELDELLFRDIGLCGCGYFDATVSMIYDYLKLKEWYTSDEYTYEGWQEKLADFRKEYDEILYEFFCYVLDNKGFTEHGTSVQSAWVTDKGKRLVELLEESGE